MALVEQNQQTSSQSESSSALQLKKATINNQQQQSSSNYYYQRRQKEEEKQKRSVITPVISISKKQELIEEVYSIIKDNSGKIRAADLDRIIKNKHDVRFAITRLTVSGKICRKRGLGINGIEYYYHDTQSETFSKFRKMDRKAFNQSTY